MTWTTFASLGVGPGTTPQLDANFAVLSGLVPIPCTVSGTNVLLLTSTAGAATIAAYQQNMILTGIAAATNSGAVTAALGLLSSLPIYKDSQNGPVALSGSEIVQNCAFSLRYDSALNSGGGGFHLNTGTGILNGQTISLSALSILGGDAITRLTSQLATVTFNATLTPGQYALATVPFSGAVVSDNVILGLPASPPASVNFLGYVLAAGSVGVRGWNMAAGATVTLTTATLRVTDLGFLT